MSRNINNRQNICKLHPRHKGVLKPKVKCTKCARIYNKNKRPKFDPTIHNERY